MLLWAHLHGNEPLVVVSSRDSDEGSDEGSGSDEATPEALMLNVSLRREHGGRPALARDARVLKKPRPEGMARGTMMVCKLAGNPDGIDRLVEYFGGVGALLVGSTLSVTAHGHTSHSQRQRVVGHPWLRRPRALALALALAHGSGLGSGA